MNYFLCTLCDIRTIDKYVDSPWKKRLLCIDAISVEVNNCLLYNVLLVI